VENLYDLLPTIRSRSLVLQLSRLSEEEMKQFAEARSLPDAELRVALAEGSPGIAACLDVAEFRTRRALVLAAFECAAGLKPFSEWVQQSESFANSRSEKLDSYLKPAYGVLEAILVSAIAGGNEYGLYAGRAAKHRDIQARIRKVAESVTFNWLERAVQYLDELVLMVRRNIQKTAALDAMIIKLRNA
jgi:DNA polymerase-3 subunit delta'